MALAAKPVEVTVTLVDKLGKKSIMRFSMQAGVDHAANLANAAAVVAALGAVTYSTIAGYSVNYPFAENAFALPAETTGLNAQYALIVNRVDATEEKWATMKVPNPDRGIFIATTGSNAGKLDPSDAAVIAYVGLFVDGAEAYISDGEFLLAASQDNTKGKLVTRGAILG